MGNLPSHRNASTHLSAERAEHREWIGGRAVTLLSHYWRDDDPIELTAAIGADWAEVLEGIPQQFIHRACIQYQRDEPRRKPTPGAIYQIAVRMLPKPKPVEPTETAEDRKRRIERESKTPEERKAFTESVFKDLNMTETRHERVAK